MWDNFGKLLLLFGVILVISGLLIILAGRVFGLGRLPGDVFIQRGNFTIYFPIVSCIVLSILLTIIINVFRR